MPSCYQDLNFVIESNMMTSFEREREVDWYLLIGYYTSLLFHHRGSPCRPFRGVTHDSYVYIRIASIEKKKEEFIMSSLLVFYFIQGQNRCTCSRMMWVIHMISFL